jgi:hypothetical protein
VTAARRAACARASGIEHIFTGYDQQAFLFGLLIIAAAVGASRPAEHGHKRKSGRYSALPAAMSEATVVATGATAAAVEVIRQHPHEYTVQLRYFLISMAASDAPCGGGLASTVRGDGGLWNHGAHAAKVHRMDGQLHHLDAFAS